MDIWEMLRSGAIVAPGVDTALLRLLDAFPWWEFIPGGVFRRRFAGKLHYLVASLSECNEETLEEAVAARLLCTTRRIWSAPAGIVLYRSGEVKKILGSEYDSVMCARCVSAEARFATTGLLSPSANLKLLGL